MDCPHYCPIIHQITWIVAKIPQIPLRPNSTHIHSTMYIHTCLEFLLEYRSIFKIRDVWFCMRQGNFRYEKKVAKSNSIFYEVLMMSMPTIYMVLVHWPSQPILCWWGSMLIGLGAGAIIKIWNIEEWW